MDENVEGKALIELQHVPSSLWVDLVGSFLGELEYPRNDGVHSLSVSNFRVVIA